MATTAKNSTISPIVGGASFLLLCGIAIFVWHHFGKPLGFGNNETLARLRYEQSVDIEKRNADMAADRLRWQEWIGQNCSVRGNRVVRPSVEVVLYSCADGTTWESEPGRPPSTWLLRHPAPGAATQP